MFNIHNKLNEWFNKFSRRAARITGSFYAFALAFLVIILWFAFGPLYHFSEFYQMLVNTGTTIITFLMVFLIQNTQNRDTQSINLKLDELIMSNKESRNFFLDLEHLSDEQLKQLEEKFKTIKKEEEKVLDQTLEV